MCLPSDAFFNTFCLGFLSSRCGCLFTGAPSAQLLLLTLDEGMSPHLPLLTLNVGSLTFDPPLPALAMILGCGGLLWLPHPDLGVALLWTRPDFGHAVARLATNHDLGQG